MLLVVVVNFFLLKHSPTNFNESFIKHKKLFSVDELQ
jgi:hypothetical protein